MRALEQASLRRFEDEMITHSKRFSPRLCAVLGDVQLLHAVRSAIARAMAYGFTLRGPIRIFVEMTFLRGSAFDTDPQYPRLGEALRASDDQMQRAEEIHEAALDYFVRVSGPGAANARKALRDLSLRARMPLPFSSSDFVAGMLEEFRCVFPQKAEYVGKDALTELIYESRGAAQTYKFTTVREQSLMCVLLFAFGHGCTDDPLYPWIARTLADERIVDPRMRGARLEKKAVTWLEHVLARNDQGVAG